MRTHDHNSAREPKPGFHPRLSRRSSAVPSEVPPSQAPVASPALAAAPAPSRPLAAPFSSATGTVSPPVSQPVSHVVSQPVSQPRLVPQLKAASAPQLKAASQAASQTPQAPQLTPAAHFSTHPKSVPAVRRVTIQAPPARVHIHENSSPRFLEPKKHDCQPAKDRSQQRRSDQGRSGQGRPDQGRPNPSRSSKPRPASEPGPSSRLHHRLNHLQSSSQRTPIALGPGPQLADPKHSPAHYNPITATANPITATADPRTAEADPKTSTSHPTELKPVPGAAPRRVPLARKPVPPPPDDLEVNAALVEATVISPSLDQPSPRDTSNDSSDARWSSSPNTYRHSQILELGRAVPLDVLAPDVPREVQIRRARDSILSMNSVLSDLTAQRGQLGRPASPASSSGSSIDPNFNASPRAADPPTAVGSHAAPKSKDEETSTPAEPESERQSVQPESEHQLAHQSAQSESEHQSTQADSKSEPKSQSTQSTQEAELAPGLGTIHLQQPGGSAQPKPPLPPSHADKPSRPASRSQQLDQLEQSPEKPFTRPMSHYSSPPQPAHPRESSSQEASPANPRPRIVSDSKNKRSPSSPIEIPSRDEPEIAPLSQHSDSSNSAQRSHTPPLRNPPGFAAPVSPSHFPTPLRQQALSTDSPMQPKDGNGDGNGDNEASAIYAATPAQDTSYRSDRRNLTSPTLKASVQSFSSYGTPTGRPDNHHSDPGPSYADSQKSPDAARDADFVRRHRRGPSEHLERSRKSSSEEGNSSFNSVDQHTYSDAQASYAAQPADASSAPSPIESHLASNPGSNATSNPASSATDADLAAPHSPSSIEPTPPAMIDETAAQRKPFGHRATHSASGEPFSEISPDRRQPSSVVNASPEREPRSHMHHRRIQSDNGAAQHHESRSSSGPKIDELHPEHPHEHIDEHGEEHGDEHDDYGGKHGGKHKREHAHHHGSEHVSRPHGHAHSHSFSPASHAFHEGPRRGHNKNVSEPANVVQTAGVAHKRNFTKKSSQNMLAQNPAKYDIEDIGLPGPERVSLEKFIDALSKISIEVQMDESKRKEGRRRSNNASRALEGWI